MKRADFTMHDGRNLAWYEAGEGPPIVLLHGWSMSAAVYFELVQMLSGSFGLLAPDLPGHGHSDPVDPVSFSVLTEDLAVWLSARTDRPVCLVGWSLGGMLAMELACRLPALVERLVLIGTTPRFTNTDDWSSGLPLIQVRALARNLERRFEATLGDFYSLAFSGEEMPRERQMAIREFAVKQRRLPVRETAAALLGLLTTQDQRHLPARINQPVLVMHGQEDRITPVAAGRLLSAALPQGRIVEFAGVGHAPFLSRPKQAAALIAEFC